MIASGAKKPGDNIQEIYGKEGTNIFFPVYQFHICEKDQYPKGGKCDTVEKHREAADDDLAQNRNGIWATISIRRWPSNTYNSKF